MVLDSEEQRKLLLACVATINWPGKDLEVGFNLLTAIKQAIVKEN